ncbi:hypothetical protein KCMC57_up63550 [Kitasatospora sp. CMC57]|uniref:Integrase catalytic domain-containing protein n=1 Tax=Kitasatospora sp. CMC57 TaxID=3231513 RepID=A0AB33K8H1_9ACTN
MTTWTIDTTRIPLNDHHAPLHLLLAVDEATGAITMARLIDQPNDTTVARALTETLESRPTPNAIAIDHNRALRDHPDSALRSTCSTRGIRLTAARALTPCSKAIAERALRAVLRHLSDARTRPALDALLPRAVDAYHRQLSAA